MASPRRFGTLSLAAVAVASGLLGGCKVMTIDEDRALRASRGKDFDAARYVEEIWDSKAVPEINRKTIPVDRLISAIGSDLDRAGAQFGNRASEGSAWTFVIRGEGVISAIDTRSRRGSATIALDGSPGRPAKLQIGPVISGTAVRDALAFVAFNDFADQLAFADAGSALTERALRTVRPALRQLSPGQRIRFVGIVNLRATGDPLVITPVSISLMTSG